MTQISVMLASAACTTACVLLSHTLVKLCTWCGVFVQNPCLDVSGTVGSSLSAKLRFCMIGFGTSMWLKHSSY